MSAERPERPAEVALDHADHADAVEGHTDIAVASVNVEGTEIECSSRNATKLGVGMLTVRRRVRVALFSTGDEIVEPGTTRPAPALFDANRYLLAGLIERLGGVMLASGYAAAVIGLVGIPSGKRMLAWAAPVGRMAFSNYLGQSLILGWIFYGYGFGLFGRTSVTAALAIGLCVYAAQAGISAWWLRRYRYGPVEWLWRSLMYGAWQPMALRGA